MATPETLVLFEAARRRRAEMITAGVVANEVFYDAFPATQMRSQSPEMNPSFQAATRLLHLARLELDNIDYKVNE